jgi:hypothetical protein
MSYYDNRIDPASAALALILIVLIYWLLFIMMAVKP